MGSGGRSALTRSIGASSSTGAAGTSAAGTSAFFWRNRTVKTTTAVAKLASALGRPELARDPRFRSNEERTRNVEELASELEPAFAARATAEWLAALEACGIPCGPLNDVAQVLADPQVRARNMVVTADDPDAGRFSLAGNPVKLSGVEDPATRGPAPRLDEHRAALLAELEGG